MILYFSLPPTMFLNDIGPNWHLCRQILKFIFINVKVRRYLTLGFSLDASSTGFCQVVGFFYPSVATRKVWVVHMSALSLVGHVGAAKPLMCTLPKCQQRLVHRPRLQETEKRTQKKTRRSFTLIRYSQIKEKKDAESTDSNATHNNGVSHNCIGGKWGRCERVGWGLFWPKSHYWCVSLCS